jgi:hypothetical protein
MIHISSANSMARTETEYRLFTHCFLTMAIKLRSRPRIACLLCVLLSLLANGLGFAAKSSSEMNTNHSGLETVSRREKEESSISVAFLGNSILYFNDCPRLVQRMLEHSGRYSSVQQDSCLRGGASLPSLWEEGNGMTSKFRIPAAQRNDGTFDTGAPMVSALFGEEMEWDFVVMNDYTQAPARDSNRRRTLEVLRKHYAPLFQKSNVVPVFLQTFAYKVPNMNGSEDLGGVDSFTDKVLEGYQIYQELLETLLGRECRVAPVGEAFRVLYHEHRVLWEKLYSWDDFHPSPHGTWLEACVIYCTVTGEAPPAYTDLDSWWNQARYLQPPSQEPMPRPTVGEANELRLLACQICQVMECNPTDPFTGGAKMISDGELRPFKL